MAVQGMVLEHGDDGGGERRAGDAAAGGGATDARRTVEGDDEGRGALVDGDDGWENSGRGRIRREHVVCAEWIGVRHRGGVRGGGDVRRGERVVSNRARRAVGNM